MSEELNVIMSKRESIMRRIKAFEEHMQYLSMPLSPPAVQELQLRIGNLQNLYEKYDEVQSQIEYFSDDENFQFRARRNFESKYFKTLSEAQSLLSEYNKTLNSHECLYTSDNNIIKPPFVSLPKFGGSYENWLEFRDNFISLIHSNEEIDDIIKFRYLKMSLEGSAATLIQPIEFTSNNYCVAWNLLCDRFNNKNLLIKSHVSALFNLDCCAKESSVAIKQLIDNLMKNLQALKSLGEPVTQWDTLLIYIVTQKLDKKTYRGWEEYKVVFKKDDKIKLDDILEFLCNRIELLKTLEQSRNQSVDTSIKSIANFCPRCKAEVD